MSQTKCRTIDLVASQVIAASGQSVEFSIPADYDEITIFADTTAVSGTSPTLDIFYLTSPDGVKWYFHSTMTQITAVSQTALNIANTIGERFSLFYSIGGTSPSFTLSAKATLKKRW